MKNTTKVSAVLMGIVLGLDASVLLTKTDAIAPENVIALMSILVVALEFFDNSKVARQVCRFSVAMIGGVAVREYSQMSMETCFIISVITIVVMGALIAIKGALKSPAQATPSAKNSGKYAKGSHEAGSDVDAQ